LLPGLPSFGQALDLLVGQAELDGGEGFTCRGALKVSLIQHEEELRKRDKQAERGQPMPVEVAGTEKRRERACVTRSAV